MVNRLSDEAVSASLDAGHTSLAWKVPKPSGFLAGIDFQQVLESPHPTEIIQAMPAQPLLYAIKQKGIAECLDILPLLSEEQVTRILDYDCWKDNRLDIRQIFQWMRAFGQVSSQQLYERFSELDEEYQLATLSGLFRVYTEEEFEKLPQELQDRLFAMPCNTVFYEILADTPDDVEFIHQLVQAAAEHNLRYAYALISYSSHVPPNEQEDLMRQFRNARMEEDGFVTINEAATLFQPTVAPGVLSNKWAAAKEETTALAVEAGENEIFLDTVLRQAFQSGWDLDQQFAVHQGLLYVANSLCVVSRVEPDDVTGLNRILEQVRALVGLALDKLSGHNPVLALKILEKEHAKGLFQFALSMIHEVRLEFLARLAVAFPEQATLMTKLLKSQRFGALVWQVDRLFTDRFSFEMIEVLKGLFNRYPMRPESLLQEKDKITFEPIASLRQFEILYHYVNGMAAWLRIAEKADALAAGSLEKGLTTALVRALVGESFAFAPLTKEEKESFAQLSVDAVKERMDAFQADLARELVIERDTWVVSAEQGVWEKGIEYAMFFMKDYVLGLMQAKKSFTGDISALVVSAETEESHDGSKH